jgi:hypothetical protein
MTSVVETLKEKPGMRATRSVIGAASLLAAVIACNTPGAAISAPTTAPIESTPQVIVVTATTLPATSGPVLKPTVNAPPTAFQPTAAQPGFARNITFSETPNVAAGVREFHGGVVRVYALWLYFNMTDGLEVRRDWYKDGEIWITRTEPWDFAKYGANGTIKDISIYDEEDGLPSGHYELKLYIENVAQFTSADDAALRSFDIAEPADGGQ